VYYKSPFIYDQLIRNNHKGQHIMTESFTLEVEFNGERKEYKAELRLFGYTYKIAIQINDVEVIFEPDEERNYRAVLADTELRNHNIKPNLLQAIAAELERAFK
jgi:hypothetical protein